MVGRLLEIGVIGCGVGGHAAAFLLADAGHSVTVMERFAEARPMGAGLLLQPTGLAVLDRLGIGDAARDLGANLALLDSVRLAGAIAASADVAEALARFERLRLPPTRYYRQASHLLTPFFQSRRSPGCATPSWGRCTACRWHAASWPPPSAARGRGGARRPVSTAPDAIGWTIRPAGARASPNVPA